MCRLFGMSGGPNRVAATFWLLDAPDSLSAQSHRDPDGTGVGSYDPDGHPVVFKQPLAAYADQQFAREAREVQSRTFVAHIRYASTGAISAQNTHPFEQDGRLFAHNGVIGDVPGLEREVGPETMRLVGGQTDSERFFALITKHIAAGADPASAITEAAGWVAANLPVFALNLILISDDELWALRYPDTHELHWLQRAAGEALEHRATPGEVRVHSEHLARHPSVVVASEPMDADSGWRALEPGELLHVDGELKVTVRHAVEAAPAHPLTLADLDPKAAASQQKA
jgi:predicted glutamine amidotransferase